MISILISKKITCSELSFFLKQLFSEIEFNVHKSLAEISDQNVTTVIVSEYTNIYKTKIELWLRNNENAIALSQYIGQQLSIVFNCDAITEVAVEDYPKDQYSSLLIRGKQQFLIDDDGIEFDNYEAKIKYEWTKEITQFNNKGLPK